MAENDEQDDTPQHGANYKRPRTQPGRDRDQLVRKHDDYKSNPFGIPIVETIPSDDMTPPPQSAPDQVEILAARIDSRTRTIEKRPGPTPTQPALTAAITAHVVGAQVGAQVAEQVSKIADFMRDEMKKDRDLQRKLTETAGLAEIKSVEAWSELLRSMAWKGATIIFGALAAILAALRLAGR